MPQLSNWGILEETQHKPLPCILSTATIYTCLSAGQEATRTSMWHSRATGSNSFGRSHLQKLASMNLVSQLEGLLAVRNSSSHGQVGMMGSTLMSFASLKFPLLTQSKILKGWDR
jgi:hypothetical protein